MTVPGIFRSLLDKLLSDIDCGVLDQTPVADTATSTRPIHVLTYGKMLLSHVLLSDLDVVVHDHLVDKRKA